MIQREGRWKSDAYKEYTRNNIDDSRRVSRKLAVHSKGGRDSRGKEQCGVSNYHLYTTTVVSNYLGVGGVEWYGTIRRLGNPRRL